MNPLCEWTGRDSYPRFGEGNEEKTVRLVDFDKPENNDFLVTNQFQLDGLKQPIFPDIVIFVNGIPLVLIECKSPYIKEPIQEFLVLMQHFM